MNVITCFPPPLFVFLFCFAIVQLISFNCSEGFVFKVIKSGLGNQSNAARDADDD